MSILINKNTRIIHYAGEKIDNKESLKREARYLKQGHIWCFKLTTRTVIDGHIGGNVSKYINHSCTPNCSFEVVGKTIWIIAAKRIEKGEELVYDYNTEGDNVIPCRCRPNCKTRL
mgnify:CR=1 FL=1